MYTALSSYMFSLSLSAVEDIIGLKTCGFVFLMVQPNFMVKILYITFKDPVNI